MAPDDAAPLRTAGDRSAKTEISNRLVEILVEATGRGPEAIRAYVHDDLVVCVLRGSLSRSERSITDAGRGEKVLEHRRMIQEAIRERAQAMIEEVTGKQVLAFLSDNSLEPDIAVEAFVLG